MKRLIVIGVFAGLLAGAAVGRAQSATAMFHGDPQHCGVYRSPEVKASPGAKWQFKTGGKIVSSPALAGGVLYIGSGDGALYALDAGTGKQRWRFATGGAVDSSPAIAEGLVFALSRDGNCYAVKASTGKLKWKFRTGGEKHFGAKGLFGVVAETQYMEDPWDFYLSSPAVAEGRVYFGSSDGTVYAVEAATGREAWRFRTGGVVHSSPAVWQGTVYIGSWDTYLYALDARTGKERWRYKTDSEGTIFTGIQSSPAVADGTVYFGCRDAKLHAVAADTGKEKWAVPIANRNWVVSTPALRDGLVYFGTSDSHRFMALDARTGKTVHELPLGMFLFSSPALVGDTAYIGSMNGRLYAVDLRAGTERWHFETEASKANAQGVRLPDGTLSPKTFTAETWVPDKFAAAVDSILGLGSVLSSPVVDKGVVYFGSTDGYVYALE